MYFNTMVVYLTVPYILLRAPWYNFSWIVWRSGDYTDVFTVLMYAAPHCLHPPLGLFLFLFIYYYFAVCVCARASICCAWFVSFLSYYDDTGAIAIGPHYRIKIYSEGEFPSFVFFPRSSFFSTHRPNVVFFCFFHCFPLCAHKMALYQWVIEANRKK